MPQPDKILGNPFRAAGPPANMAKLILLRHKVCPSNLVLPAVISSLQFRFKQTESGAVLPFHDRPHEVVASPHARSRNPLGCALENPLEESNIINSFGRHRFFKFSFFILYYDTLLPRSNELYDQPFLGAVFHVIVITKYSYHYPIIRTFRRANRQMLLNYIYYTISLTLKGSIYAKWRLLSAMTESMLSVGLACLLAIEVDKEFDLATRDAVDAVPVFGLFFVCPVTAEPPTDREVPIFRDLVSCTKRLLNSVLLGALFRNPGPCQNPSYLIRTLLRQENAYIPGFRPLQDSIQPCGEC